MSILEQRAEKKMELRHSREKLPVQSKTDASFEEVREYVRETLLASGNLALGYSTETRPKLKETVFQLVSEKYPQMSRLDRAGVTDSMLDDIIGYGPIQPLIEDPQVTDIMVNTYNRIFYKKLGQRTPIRSDIQFREEKHLRDVIEKIVSTVGRRVDESSTMVDARMPDGSRINAVVPPIALDGAALTIRRFMHHIDAEEIVKQKVVTREQLEVLETFIRARLNIIVSGGTGAGKTTFLNVLSQFIPQTERIVTIEDVAELRLKIPNIVRLETRNVNIEGKGDVTAQVLVANALRMKPNRIIVGECRRGEAFDMLQAMNTGHEGSLTTLHANSPRDALYRLENMVLMSGYSLPVEAIREQIGSAIQLIIHLEEEENGPVVTHISEVVKRNEQDGEISVFDLYRRQEGALVKIKEPGEIILAKLAKMR